jgi:MFS family permease
MQPAAEPWLSRALPLAGLTLLTLMPVTLPVPVLRELVAERFGVSELLTSLFMSINMIGAVLAAPLAGALADRFGRRKQLVVGALLVDALCFWALTAPVSFPVFMGLRLLEGGAHIFALSLVLSIASQSIDDARRGRVMGMVGGGIMLGVALGAPLGGVLGRTSALLPLQCGALLALAAALLAALALQERPAGEPGAAGEPAATQRPGARAIAAALRATPELAVPLWFALVDRFTVGFFTSTFSLYLRAIHELPQPRIGALIAVFMLPFALLSYPFGRLSERWSRVWMLCGGSVIYGLGTASLGWWSPDLLIALMLGLGVSAAVMFVPSMLLTVELAPPQIRSTAMGAFNAAGSLGFILGPITGGWVSQSVATHWGWTAGYRAAFAVAGASVILCVLLALPALRRLVREKRTT